MPCLLQALRRHLQNHSTNPDAHFPLPKASHFAVTAYSVQFTCGAVDVDVMVSYDWSNEEAAGYDALYNLSCKQTTKGSRFWCVNLLFDTCRSLDFIKKLGVYVYLRYHKLVQNSLMPDKLSFGIFVLAKTTTVLMLSCDGCGSGTRWPPPAFRRSSFRNNPMRSKN